jgi:hypothetical protein
MFKKIAQKIKSLLFVAEKIKSDSPVAKAQAKVVDDLAAKADQVATIAKVAAENIAKEAKKEVNKAVKQAKAPAAKKASAKKAAAKKTTK